MASLNLIHAVLNKRKLTKSPSWNHDHRSVAGLFSFSSWLSTVHGGQNLHIFCQNHHRLIAAQSIRRLPPIDHQIPHFAAAFVQFAKNFRQWRFNASTEDHTSNDIHLHGKRMVAGVGDIFWGRRLCWWALLKRNICLTTEANIPIEFVKHIWWLPLYWMLISSPYASSTCQVPFALTGSSIKGWY